MSYVILFEAVPNPGREEDYLALATPLNELLPQQPGFLGIDRARSIMTEGKLLSAKAGAALFIEGQEILTRSRQSFVPVDQGILMNDSGVTKPQMEGGQVVVGIWYGDGPAKDYAVPQHERMDFSHANGGPKYLERPVLEASNGMARRLSARMK